MIKCHYDNILDFVDNPDNDGEIMIALTNLGDKAQVIEPNARVAQGMFIKYLTTDNDKVDAERVGGVGSTNA